MEAGSVLWPIIGPSFAAHFFFFFFFIISFWILALFLFSFPRWIVTGHCGWRFRFMGETPPVGASRSVLLASDRDQSLSPEAAIKREQTHRTWFSVVGLPSSVTHCRPSISSRPTPPLPIFRSLFSRPDLASWRVCRCCARHRQQTTRAEDSRRRGLTTTTRRSTHSPLGVSWVTAS